MTSRPKRYRHYTLCPQAPEDIRGPLHRTKDPRLHKKRQEWIRARLSEDYTYKAISRRLGINITSVGNIIMTHDLRDKKPPSASYIAYYKLGLSIGYFRDAFDAAPQKLQNLIMDHALDKNLSLTEATISIMARMMETSHETP